ncbi:hypothetical protein DXT99_19550 [Pontibacter diazotrophicus]|uniref:Uncharacterized protein n=1 Tax=Pontibacter diazotrophicus TaxID=1400979 RepID=A0A3D8L7K0_9BACT|nr:hypothetical protein [Pontibacter diazotrophicus]RDV13391.1 hypothetical protein DXT99_19550 [Pontibacter diazotrophicus]
MKILVLLYAAFFGFGLAVQNTVQVDESAKVVMNHTEATTPELEQPVMDVLLDTVEITVATPAAVALN